LSPATPGYYPAPAISVGKRQSLRLYNPVERRSGKRPDTLGPYRRRSVYRSAGGRRPRFALIRNVRAARIPATAAGDASHKGTCGPPGLTSTARACDDQVPRLDDLTSIYGARSRNPDVENPAIGYHDV